MSSRTSPAESRDNSPPAQNSDKESSTPPNDVELKSMRPDAPKGSIPLGEDIMQLARIGEIGAMQNLFANKKLTANHRDEEGITPLHVCFHPYGVICLKTIALIPFPP